MDEPNTSEVNADCPAQLMLHINLDATCLGDPTLTARFCQWRDSQATEIDFPERWGSTRDFVGFYGLQVQYTAYKSVSREVYGGTEWEYRCVSVKSAGHAKLMAQTMDKLEKGLARTSEKRGESRDYTDTIQRIAEIFGIHRIVFTDWGKDYLPSKKIEHEVMTLCPALKRIGELLEEAQRKAKV